MKRSAAVGMPWPSRRQRASWRACGLLLALALAAESSVSAALALPGAVLRGGGWAGGPRWARTGFLGVDGALNRGALPPAPGWAARVDPPQRPSLEPAPARPLAPVGAAALPAPAAGLTARPGIVNPWAVQPRWVGLGWARARPWGWGWYGPSTMAAWDWWGLQSVAWRVGTLTSAAVINAAVGTAIANQQPTIVVPGSGGQLQLIFGTIQPFGPVQVSFLVDGAAGSYAVSADCRSGRLNGAPPAAPAQAELLNAACQVGFGPD